MNVAVLENANTFEADFERYLDEMEGEVDLRIIFNADNASAAHLMLAFELNEVLAFDPTIVTYQQYNSFMMAMYSLLNRGKLGIREVHIFHLDAEEMQSMLTDLWSGRRNYLDVVLKEVKVFVVGRDSKQQIYI